jgi:hypothetical protein
VIHGIHVKHKSGILTGLLEMLRRGCTHRDLRQGLITMIWRGARDINPSLLIIHALFTFSWDLCQAVLTGFISKKSGILIGLLKMLGRTRRPPAWLTAKTNYHASMVIYANKTQDMNPFLDICLLYTWHDETFFLVCQWSVAGSILSVQPSTRRWRENRNIYLFPLNLSLEIQTPWRRVYK